MLKRNPVAWLLVSWMFLPAMLLAAEEAQRGDLTLAYFHRPPYFVRGNPPSGILIERAAAVFNDAGIRYKFVEMPVNRTFRDIKNNEPLCAVGLIRNAERESFGWYSQPFYQSERLVVLVKATKVERFAGVESLSQLVSDQRFCPGLAKSFVYSSDELNDRLRARQVACRMPDAFHHNLFGMLLAERVDYIVVTQEESEYLERQEKPGTFAALHFKDAPQTIDRYFLCSNSTDPDVRDRIDASIARVLMHR